MRAGEEGLGNAWGQEGWAWVRVIETVQSAPAAAAVGHLWRYLCEPL